MRTMMLDPPVCNRWGQSPSAHTLGVGTRHHLLQGDLFRAVLLWGYCQ